GRKIQATEHAVFRTSFEQATLARGQVPQTDGGHCGAAVRVLGEDRGQGLAIGRDAVAEMGVLLVLGDLDRGTLEHFTSDDIPASHRMVRADGGQNLAIRGEETGGDLSVVLEARRAQAQEGNGWKRIALKVVTRRRGAWLNTFSFRADGLRPRFAEGEARP